MASRKLDDLTDAIKPLIFELLARCTEKKIPVFIVDTLRTLEEQEENIKNGVSWTLHSKHLPGPDGKSRAIDIVPYSQYLLHGAEATKLAWDAGDDLWIVVGEIGEGLGLVWGGRWKVRDMGHFELKED